MRRAPGWFVLGQIALELSALVVLLRLLATPRPKVHDDSAQSPAVKAPAIPTFITEVVDSGARRYRLLSAGGFLFAGFYSDGRVRLATPRGRRFSGVVVAQRAIVADLRADVSFEMEILSQGSQVSVRMNGGPYDGQTLRCERLE